MRILFLNLIGTLGGSERSLLEMLAVLRQLEPAWELYLIIGTDGPLKIEAEKLGVKTEVIPVPDEVLVVFDSRRKGVLGIMHNIRRMFVGRGKGRRFLSVLRERVKALNPALIHSNSSKCHLFVRMMRLPRIAVVWHVRDFINSPGLLRSALKRAAASADLVLANSEATAANARGVVGSVPVRVVFNAVNTDAFSPGPARRELLDELAGLPVASSDVLRVGILASYARWKGQDLFLKAAAKVAERFKNVRFYVIGGPVFSTQGSQFSLDELKSMAHESKLGDRVGFIPFQAEPVLVYRALDVVVHASTKPEPFGRTIAEAMSCGRAVVASAAGGAVELFNDGTDAIGVRPNDVDALASAIVRLLQDEKLRASLGTAARKTALERFSLERLGREMQNIFVELVEENRS